MDLAPGGVGDLHGNVLGIAPAGGPILIAANADSTSAVTESNEGNNSFTWISVATGLLR